jgi:hypothetical protein
MGGFVRETDTDQRTAGTFWGVQEWWRNAARGRDGPGLLDNLECLDDHLFVKSHPDPLSGLEVVDNALLALVAVIAQDDGLDAKLNLIGRPRLRSVLGLPWSAAFVIHWRY